MADSENTALRVTAGALGGLLLILLFTHWYRATLGSEVITASAWESLALGRLLLLFAAVGVIGMALAPLVAAQFGLELPDVDDQELGHGLVVISAVLTAYLVLRVAVPPHFYQVTDLLGSDASDAGVTVNVLAPAVIALFVMAGIGVVGHQIAVASGGFDISRCATVFREFWDSRATKIRKADLPEYKPPTDGATS